MLTTWIAINVLKRIFNKALEPTLLLVKHCRKPTSFFTINGRLSCENSQSIVVYDIALLTLFILVRAIPTPLKNMSSSVGMMTFPTEWKVIKAMFQTTHQLSYTLYNPEILPRLDGHAQPPPFLQQLHLLPKKKRRNPHFGEKKIWEKGRHY